MHGQNYREDASANPLAPGTCKSESEASCQMSSPPQPPPPQPLTFDSSCMLRSFTPVTHQICCWQEFDLDDTRDKDAA